MYSHEQLLYYFMIMSFVVIFLSMMAGRVTEW